MKRLALIFALLLASIAASAQISNVKTQESIKTVAKFRMGLCSLKAQGDVYYFSIASSNDLDGSEIVYLGDSKESALQTMQDLIDLHKSMGKGDFAEFSLNIQGKEVNYKVMKKDGSNLTFCDMGTIGQIFIANVEIKNMIKKLADD